MSTNDLTTAFTILSLSNGTSLPSRLITVTLVPLLFPTVAAHFKVAADYLFYKIVGLLAEIIQRPVINYEIIVVVLVDVAVCMVALNWLDAWPLNQQGQRVKLLPCSLDLLRFADMHEDDHMAVRRHNSGVSYKVVIRRKHLNVIHALDCFRFDADNFILEGWNPLFVSGVPSMSKMELLMLGGLNLEELSRNQLSALNSALIDTGDRASEFAVRLAALAQVGALPEALDAISKSLETQSDSLQTVSGALQDYETAMEGITDHVQDHESMVSIYDDFAEAVNKGQINTEEARNQMDLLIGKVVSLDEARQWVKNNEGLF